MYTNVGITTDVTSVLIQNVGSWNYATYLQIIQQSINSLVGIIVLHKTLTPFFTDVCELAANNSLPQAIGLAVASRGFSAYTEGLKWYDWMHCCVLDMFMDSTELIDVANDHIETITGDMTTIHLWNVSPESLAWVRKHGPERLNCVYKIHTTNDEKIDGGELYSPFIDDYGASLYLNPDTSARGIYVPGVPTVFLGKCVTKKVTFNFNDERLVKADFHSITELKQPFKTIGTIIKVDKYDMELSLPMCYNQDYMYRMTADVSATNTTKKVINIHSVYGTPMQLFLDLTALSNEQRKGRNWSDLRCTLLMLNYLKSTNYSYSLTITNMDLTTKTVVYRNQLSVSLF